MTDLGGPNVVRGSPSSSKGNAGSWEQLGRLQSCKEGVSTEDLAKDLEKQLWEPDLKYWEDQF